MTSKNRVTVRDAQESDIPALIAIKGAGSDALHRDRLRDAREASGFRYIVLVREQEVIGFACLVFRRPSHWSDADSTENLPQIVDLQVKELHRGQGYGSAFIQALEHAAAEAGCKQLYLSVESLTNPRAYALYQRLGYQPLQSQPYLSVWEFKDSDGTLHRGEDWSVDMLKHL